MSGHRAVYVEWHDLLGIPWKKGGVTPRGMDCATIAEVILRRAERVPYDAAHNFLTRPSDGAVRLGDDADSATLVGDLVLSRDEQGLARRLFVLVEPDRGTFLTSSHDHGSIAVRRFAIKDIVGAYRIKREASS
jgi:hypothetical protein